MSIVDEKFACPDCGSTFPVTESVIVQIYQGKRTNSGEPNSTAYKEWLINESYNYALPIAKDVKCKCGGEVSYLIDSNSIYRYVCRKCHKLVGE